MSFSKEHSLTKRGMLWKEHQQQHQVAMQIVLKVTCLLCGTTSVDTFMSSTQQHETIRRAMDLLEIH